MPDLLTWILALRISIPQMVDVAARETGVDPTLAVCICQQESGFNPLAEGDQGRARGLWQFHLPTWETMRREMGTDTMDRRRDAIASTQTALWALAHGYGKHWATYIGCGGMP